MLDRASTFADPEIVSLLKKRFVPTAIDQAYQRRQQDAEGEFYRKIAGQGPRSNFKATTQGLYVATPGGKLLAYNNNRGPQRVRRVLKDALARFKPDDAAPIQAGKPDARYNPKPPEAGLVVRVRAKVLDGYDEPNDQWQQIFQRAVSRDNLWIRADEHKVLAQGKMPSSLAKRIARFHLIDNTRGEPPMWKDDEVKKLDLKSDDGRISGSVSVATADGKRGFDAQLFGVVEAKDGKVTRFDMVAKGDYWGQGRYTPGAPRGKFPLAVSFSLADGSDTADHIPPQGSRGWLPGYIR